MKRPKYYVAECTLRWNVLAEDIDAAKAQAAGAVDEWIGEYGVKLESISLHDETEPAEADR